MPLINIVGCCLLISSVFVQFNFSSILTPIPAWNVSGPSIFNRVITASQFTLQSWAKLNFQDFRDFLIWVFNLGLKSTMTVQQGTSAAIDERENVGLKKRRIVKVDTKKLLLGASARVLFYPTLLYNVVRNKIQSDFRWWDEVCKVLFESVFLHFYN